MGMFGNTFKKAMQPGGIVDFALGGYDRVDERIAQQAAQQQQERQRQAMQAVLAKMNPVQTGGAMGPGMDGAPMGQGYTAPKRSIQDLLPDLMAAQAEGADIGPMVQMLKLGQPQEDQVYNMGDGYLGVVKPGQDPRFVAAPSVEERDNLRQAQINAANALAGVRQNQGAYYGAKAKQPYAPPRGGGGRGGSSAMDAIAAELRRRGHQVD
jgi:hypothetical protein